MPQVSLSLVLVSVPWMPTTLMALLWPTKKHSASWRLRKSMPWPLLHRTLWCTRQVWPTYLQCQSQTPAGKEWFWSIPRCQLKTYQPWWQAEKEIPSLQLLLATGSIPRWLAWLLICRQIRSTQLVLSQLMPVCTCSLQQVLSITILLRFQEPVSWSEWPLLPVRMMTGSTHRMLLHSRSSWSEWDSLSMSVVHHLWPQQVFLTTIGLQLLTRSWVVPTVLVVWSWLPPRRQPLSWTGWKWRFLATTSTRQSPEWWDSYLLNRDSPTTQSRVLQESSVPIMSSAVPRWMWALLEVPTG